MKLLLHRTNILYISSESPGLLLFGCEQESVDDLENWRWCHICLTWSVTASPCTGGAALQNRTRQLIRLSFRALVEEKEHAGKYSPGRVVLTYQGLEWWLHSYKHMAALTELAPVPSTHWVAQNCHCSYRSSDALLWLLLVLTYVVHRHTLRNTHLYIKQTVFTDPKTTKGETYLRWIFYTLIILWCIILDFRVYTGRFQWELSHRDSHGILRSSGENMKAGCTARQIIWTKATDKNILLWRKGWWDHKHIG